MHTRKRKTIYILLTMALCLGLLAAGAQLAGSYPGPGSGFEGWTAEKAVGPTTPRHVQIAHGGGYLHMVADNGNHVYYYRADNENTLNWSLIGYLDVDSNRSAADPYIATSGSYVVVSWKEYVGSTWAMAVAVSSDSGSTWTKWIDSNAACNNFEGHVYIAESKIHAAYVSDYDAGQGRRNEVYYRRFNMSLGMEHLSCPSGQLDGVAANNPCIEATSASFVNVYYQYGSASLHPIWESYTTDSGVNWNPSEKISVGSPGVDLSCPEVGVWVDNGDRRKMIVAGANNSGTYQIYSRRYWNGNWEATNKLADLGASYYPYPQICTKGTNILVVFRGSGGTFGTGVAGYLNDKTGESIGWHPLSGLFYNLIARDLPGCADCCSDGTRFYAAVAGAGSSPYNQVLTKREDTTDPTISVNDPGTYHSAGFNVTANASDDFNCSADWLLSPSSEHYDSGILHADYYYKQSSSGTWIGWPAAQGGTRDADAPWSKTFPGGTIGEGSYDFRVVVTDTANRVSENILTGVIIDRSPPTNVNLQISAPDGTSDWYISQPSVGPSVVAQDAVSGIKNTFYKHDTAADWTVYSQPFALLEGEHTISYYAEDNAGNTSTPKTFSYKADFTDPAGAITTPQGGEFFKTSFSMAADADDALSGVARVDFLFAGDLFASDDTAPYAKGCDISSYTDGEREVQARIWDHAGRSSLTSKVAIKKDTKAPTVEITEPVGEEWIRGMVSVKADVSDAAPGEIAKAEFYIDGKLFDARTSAPWMGSLDTTAWGNDWHTIAVKAWDKAGNASAEGGKAQVEQFFGNNISETNNFAEGCTRSGFDTWLCLQNPGDEIADVTVNYMLGPGQGQASARNYAVPAHSRLTVNVNSDVGPDKDVSIQCTSTKPVVSERPMYFDYSGVGGHSWKGGHTAQGVSMPGQEWYLAEGCTRDGFEEWLCVQNPGDRVANVDVEYMLGTGQVIRRSYAVAAWQRYTIYVNEEIGAGQDVSIKVTADQNIVVERPMYFLYQGVWDGGHNTMAVNSAHTEWFFAEGCTRAGFNQWICIQNPGDEPAKVDITYMTEDGTQIVKQATVQPHSRHTINANQDVAREHDVSTKLASDNPIIVERPMYFWYGNLGGFNEGSCAIGANKACSTWYLAEGCTRAGFEQWICLQNPNDEVATVRLTYMLENASCPEQVVSVAPHTRLTVRVNDFVGPDHDVSTEVQSDMPIVVERPIYSLYRGAWPAADSLNAYTFER